MAQRFIHLGPVLNFLAWDDSTDDDYDPEDVYEADDDGNDGSLTGLPYYAIATNTNASINGLELTGSDDTTNILVLNNNTSIKWKTTGGARRPMLKLNSSDQFRIGNNDADGSDKIIFEVSGLATDAAAITADELRCSYSANERNFALEKKSGNKGGMYIYGSDGSTRYPHWWFGGNATVVSGVAVGDDFDIAAFKNDGVLIDVLARFYRASGGNIEFYRPTVVYKGSGTAKHTVRADGSLATDIAALALYHAGGEQWNILGRGDSANLLRVKHTSDTYDSLYLERATTYSILRVGSPSETAKSAYLYLHGYSGLNTALRAYSGSQLRWNFILGDSTAESSTADGKRLELQAYDNSGNYLFSPLIIFRNQATPSYIYLSLLLNSNATQSILRTDRANLFLFDTNVTTAAVLQAMTSGVFGATTGITVFRHDLVAGDGAGTNFLAIDGGSSAGNESDLIFRAAGAAKWYNYILGASPNTIRWLFAGMTNDSMSLLTDATYAADFRLGYNAAKHVALRFNRNSGSYIAHHVYTGTVAAANLRWIEYLANTTAEAGSNAGSDRQVYRYMDDGTTNYHLLTQRRSDGFWFTGTGQKWIVGTVGWLKQESFDEYETTFFRDEFYSLHTNAYEGPWATDLTGSSTTTVVDGVTGGIIELTSENLTNARAGIWLKSSAAGKGTTKIASGEYPIIFECSAKKISVNGDIYCGLMSDKTNKYGAYFLVISPNWYAVTKNATSTTQTSTGIAASAFHKLKVKVVSASSIEFYVDDVLKATHTTNIYTADTVTPAITANQAASSGGVVRVDYVKFLANRNN